MSTQVQFRRGTTTQNNAFTGAAGEISVDTDLKTIRLHDGTTAGGGSTMLNNTSAQTALNKTFSTGSVWQGTAVGLAYGGTGSALTAVAGAVPYSTANGLGLTAAGTSGQILVSGGVNAPTWVPTSSISAGSSTLAATATNIAGGSAGQLVIQADTGLSTFITAGAIGTFLRSAGAGYAPTWATADVTIGSTVIDLGSSTTSLAGLNILAATGTSHWTLPAGTTAQRPVTPAAGMVRYNSTISGFEGYASGAWSSLGGVKSVDALTFIRAETTANASNGDLDFFAEDAAGTATTQVGQWNRTNLKDYTGTLVGTQTTQNVFNTTATTVNAFGAATTLALGATTGTTTVRNNLTVTGDLTINGTTTTVNATTITVDDKNIELGSVASPTNTTADGGGITLKGATDKTLNWVNATGAWTSSEDFNLVTGKTFEINAIPVLSSTSVLSDASQTSITVAGAATTLTIGGTSGTATIRNSTVAITNAATVGSTLGVTGATTLSSTLGVTGATTLSSTLAVTGATTLTGALAANGGITVDGTAFVVADTTGNTSIAGTLGVTGLITSTAGISGGPATHTTGSFSSTLGVTGTSTFTGATTHNGGLGATSGTFSTTLGVTGASTFTGATTHNGGLAATTGSFSSTLAVTGTSTFTGALTANGGVVGNASSATILQTGRTIALTGDVTYTSGSFNGSANVTGTATLANSGVTAGSYTFSNITVDAKGRVTAASSNTVSGSSANTANTLVQRDGSGNFSAGTITAAVFQTSSDARLKTNIENISYGLSEVLQLRSVKYIKNSKVEIGLIAQEVEKVLPEFVGEGDDGMKTVNYGQMVSVLVKAVQDLQKEVASLKAKLGE